MRSYDQSRDGSNLIGNGSNLIGDGSNLIGTISYHNSSRG